MAERDGPRDQAPAPPRFVDTRDGHRIACRVLDGRQPGLVFLGGFSSDMGGTKALHLEGFCRRRGRRYLRFDYRGHGESSGRFRDGTIGAWRDDALAAIGTFGDGPLVLVGSSMGAWIMLLVAAQLPARVRALVGIAAAPDFTEDLVWQRLPAESRARILDEGAIEVPSRYSAEGVPITRRLVEEARRHLILRGPVAVSCPVRLLHGSADEDVPWQTSLALLEAVRSSDATLTLVRGADHRMSSVADLARLERVLDEMLALADAG